MCEDPDNGYQLHSDSYAVSTITHRKTETNNTWLEGTYATDSVRDNTQEALVVWVFGDTFFEFHSRMEALMAAFDQLSYTVTTTFEDAQLVWDCEVSDYTRETQQEYIFARRGVIRCTLMRRPQEGLNHVAFIGPGYWRSVYLGAQLSLDTPANFIDPELTANAVALGQLAPI